MFSVAGGYVFSKWKNEGKDERKVRKERKEGKHERKGMKERKV
jgi:hypothetical protein